MAAVSTAIAVVATTAAVGGSVYSAKQQKKAAKANARAARIQQQQQQAAQARARRNAIRETRNAYGSTINQGALSGVGDSSGVQGGVGGIISQGSYNLSFLDEQARLGDQAATQLGLGAKYASRAATGAAIANLGFAALGSSTGQKGLSNILEQISGKKDSPKGSS